MGRYTLEEKHLQETWDAEWDQLEQELELNGLLIDHTETEQCLHCDASNCDLRDCPFI